jgi:glutamate 5-kinase
MDRKAAVAGAKRVVVKIGSRVLVSATTGLDAAVTDSLAAGISAARDRGVDVVIVSSGAVLAGRVRLGWVGRTLTLPEKQAAAAVGQGRLMGVWERSFSPHEKKVAQVLLTHADLADRTRYLNAGNTLSTLLANGVIPIVNENDTVAVEEIRFGDNDNLSSSVAGLVEADLLVILTDVEGVYDSDPGVNPEARLLPVIPEIDGKIRSAATLGTAAGGTGGMITKLEAAAKATAIGVPTIIANGRREGQLGEILSGGEGGTYIPSRRDTLRNRQHWIAHILKVRGRLVVDEGAARALTARNTSLLPSGIVAVEGCFERGAMVVVADGSGREIARGLANYSSTEVERIRGLRTDRIEEALGAKDYDEVIHRDNLVPSGGR